MVPSSSQVLVKDWFYKRKVVLRILSTYAHICQSQGSLSRREVWPVPSDEG